MFDEKISKASKEASVIGSLRIVVKSVLLL